MFVLLTWIGRFAGLHISVLGLQVLDNVIQTRWKVLPREQCQGKPPRPWLPLQTNG